MQRFTPNIGDVFITVEKALREAFITYLFQGLVEGTLGRGVTCLPVKQEGLDLPEPKKTGPENWKASYVLTGHLIAELRGQKEFRTSEQSTYLQEGRADVQ